MTTSDNQPPGSVVEAAGPGGMLPGVGPPNTGDVALLIDWENLKWSLQNTYNVSANASTLMDAAGAFGRVVVARAYADWTQRQLTVDAVNLYRTGIEPVYVTTGEKNSADVRLAVDAVDLCMRMTHIGTFVVVTGDKDLIHPINYIRLNGRRTVIIGVGATIAGRLVASVDRVLRYEEDLEPLVSTRRLPEPSPQSDIAIDDLFQHIVAILSEHGAGEEMSFAQIGNQLKSRIHFNAIEQFGMSFKALMLQAQDAGLIAMRTEGLVDYASLPQLGSSLNLEAAIRETASSSAAGLSFPPEPVTWSAPDQDVDIESLSSSEQATLISYIHELGTDHRDLPIRYIADALTRNSVLPGLTSGQVWRLVNSLADDGILDRQTAIGTARETGEEYEFTRLVLDPEHALVADILAERQRDLSTFFAELPPAVREVRSRFEFACEADVQQAFEQRLGRKLRSLGYDRPAIFFQDAVRANVVRLWSAPDDTVVVLMPDDPEPDAEAFAAWRSVFNRLHDTEIEAAIRYIAAAEEMVFGETMQEAVQIGSLVYLLRGVIRVRGINELGNNEANYLIKTEFVQHGIMIHEAVKATHPYYGTQSLVDTYRLNSENPLVKKALEKPLPQLSYNYRPKPAIMT